MEQQLKTVKIEGTDFLVDVEKNELRETGNPKNIISVFEMRDIETGYTFDYDRREKNIPVFHDNSAEIVQVTIAPLTKLDPEGMARKYGLTPEQVIGKPDFEIMVDQEALAARLSGRLTTVDIAGHTFYVDIPMDSLRPKDDFSTRGICFSDIEDYLSEDGKKYQIPYDPKAHELRELDYDNLTEIPKDIILVEIPHEEILDPVGYARQHGWDLRQSIKETNIKSQFLANVVKWEDSFLPSRIKENIRRKAEEESPRQSETSRRGRGIT